MRGEAFDDLRERVQSHGAAWDSRETHGDLDLKRMAAEGISKLVSMGDPQASSSRLNARRPDAAQVTGPDREILPECITNAVEAIQTKRRSEVY